MGNFLAELKRRHMYRVAAAYAVVAWVLLQLVNNVAPGLNLPNWAVTFVIVIVAVGFPIALIFAWILHLASAEGTARTKNGVADWVLSGALVAVIALIAYEQMAARNRTPQQQASVAPTIPAPQQAGTSIAVLPFANVSGDNGQEFFSDGMTDEIAAALAKVQSLRVVARTSAFQFKGQNRDIQAIGQALHADYLIEGTVRKAGNRVRITAQPVKADDGIGLWTDNYDRELNDVFATQEDIAQAIAGALRVPLGLKQGESLVSNRTGDTASYQDYLRAKTLVRVRGLKALTEAPALLDKVVARDPNFAPAWALLAQAYELIPNYDPAWFSGSVAEARRSTAESLPKAEAAAKRAIQLDPKNADGLAALALVQALRGKILAAEELFAQALELDPNNADALHQYSQLLAGVGRLKDALAMRQRVQPLEPFLVVIPLGTADIFWLNGQDDAAIAMLTEVPAEFTLRGVFLSRIYASLGRYEEAADTVLTISSSSFLPGTVEEAARLLRTAPTVVPAPQNLQRLGYLDFVYLHVGAQDRALEFHEGNLEIGYTVPLGVATLWHPSYAPLHKTERFKRYVRSIGLVDYWRERGWPDLCRAQGADDFTCD